MHFFLPHSCYDVCSTLFYLLILVHEYFPIVLKCSYPLDFKWGKEGRKEEEERKKKRNKSPVPTTLSISSCCQIPGIGRLAPHFSASTLA